MKKSTVLVLAAGVLWGFMGFFVKHLGDIGIASTGAVMLRCGVAALCFGLTIAIKDPKLFRVRPRDVWCFIGSGIFSLLFFTYCYFTSMNYIDLSTAAILLYTAPPIVMVISFFVFGEKFTGTKVLALVLAFVGCCLVSGRGESAISLKGLLLGTGSGLGYALFSIFARLAMNRGYNSLTVNFWSCLLAAVGAAVIWPPAETLSICFSSGSNIALALATGAVSCYLPYLFYTKGLEGMETGRASIMASLEPVVATLVGVFIFAQPISLMSALGVVFVLGAIVVLNVKNPHRV